MIKREYIECVFATGVVNTHNEMLRDSLAQKLTTDVKNLALIKFRTGFGVYIPIVNFKITCLIKSIFVPKNTI